MLDRICIGTMLWGSRTDEIEAHAIIACALDNGINFFDTAEIYPTFPYSKDTQGESERILGRWIKANPTCTLKISTKMKSPSNPLDIRSSVDASLQRLCTDHIDYYQLHWPSRTAYCFRNNWQYDPTVNDNDSTISLMHDTLKSLSNLIKEGKISRIGMSNETAWGVTKWNQIAIDNGFSPLTFIQNEYSLLHRLFDLDLAEACHHEGISLMAWSPLAGGLLTGKYQRHSTPIGSRRSYGGLGQRDCETVWPALESYEQVASDFGMSLHQLAMSWLWSRPLLQTAILGATTANQLKQNLRVADMQPSTEMLSAIDNVYRRYPIPF